MRVIHDLASLRLTLASAAQRCTWEVLGAGYGDLSSTHNFISVVTLAQSQNSLLTLRVVFRDVPRIAPLLWEVAFAFNCVLGSLEETLSIPS